MTTPKSQFKEPKDLLEELEIAELEKPNGTDVLVSALKSGAGIIPFWGNFFGEIISHSIPNQINDRRFKYLQNLAERFANHEEEFIKSRFTQPGVLDIFTEGGRQAANAYTEEKTAYIATFVEKSITAEEIDVLKTMSIGSILEKVNHIEIIILGHCALNWRDKKQFEEKFPDIFIPKIESTNPKHVEHKTFIQNYYMNLDGLGLIYVDRRKRQSSELDGNQITLMGAELLRRLGYEAKSSYTYQELVAKEESDRSSSLRSALRRRPGGS